MTDKDRNLRENLPKVFVTAEVYLQAPHPAIISAADYSRKDGHYLSGARYCVGNLAA